MAEPTQAALVARCRCGQVPPKDCPLHGDEANAHSQAAWERLIEASEARPGGPLRVVPDEQAEAGR